VTGRFDTIDLAAELRAMTSSPLKEQVAHLEILRADARDEIKRRIEQRDKYSVQLTISLSVIIGAAFSEKGLQRVLIAAPLVSIYFSVLILYSYRVHKVLAKYLREALEPELARLCGTKLRCEWENFYRQEHTPGIRRVFFVTALWVISAVSMGYLLTYELITRGRAIDELFVWILAVVTILYLITCCWITWFFWE
jgi:hypothetical protein